MEKKKTKPARHEQSATPRVALSRTEADAEAAAGRFDPFSGRAALSILALLVAVSYFPALSGGFVWDDMVFAEEPVIHAASGLWNIWFSPSDIKNEGHYWPLVYASFWLEHKLWGLAPVGYHAVNIVLHIINCLLLWRLLARLTVPGALVIAAVFAVHPMHVESVSWIIERKDVLSALFYLTAVLAWMRFTESPRPSGYALALGLFIAGLLSKSVVVTLPAVLLIWRWWQYGRVTGADVLWLAPFFVAAAGITAADLSFYTSRESLDLGYSLPERVLIAARALWFYLGKLLWPTELAVIYPLWEIDVGDLLAWGYVVGAVVLAALLWLGRQRIGRGPLAGALFFAVTLSPVLGFVDYGYMQFSFVADRFQYLAGIGVLAVLIGAAACGADKLPRNLRLGACGLAAIVVALLSTLTWRQAGIYQDEITFFSHVVALNPAARDAHLNLGSALFEADRAEEGLTASRIAVAQRPDSGKALANVGRALIKLAQLEEAEGHLLRARQFDPRSVIAHQNLAEVFRKQGRYTEAVASYRAVLEIDARYAPAYAGMGTALFGAQRYDEALQAMQQALALEPDPEFAPAYAGMGIALFQWERYEEAVTALEQAIALQPELPVMGSSLHVFLGRALQEVGRPEAAAERYEHAMQMEPHDREALDHLVMMRFGQQRYEEARELYRRMLEIDSGSAQTHSNLGAALYQLGRLEEALRSIERAPGLGPQPGIRPRWPGAGAQGSTAGRPIAAPDARRESADGETQKPEKTKFCGGTTIATWGRPAASTDQ